MAQWSSCGDNFGTWLSLSTMWIQGSSAYGQASREAPLPTDHLSGPSFYLFSLKINVFYKYYHLAVSNYCSFINLPANTDNMKITICKIVPFVKIIQMISNCSHKSKHFHEHRN